MKNLTRYFKSFIRLLKVPHLYYFLIPGVLVMVTYFLLENRIDAISYDADKGDLSWWQSFIQYLIDFFNWVLSQAYQFIMVTAFSPIMAILAEKADNHLSGAQFNGGLKRMLKDLWRTLLIAITATGVYLFIYVFWNLFAWITGISFITPVILFLINAFFLGFAYMDYALERYQFKVAQSWGYAFKNWKTMIILGSIFSLIFYIPYAGALLAPYLVTLMATVIWVLQKQN